MGFAAAESQSELTFKPWIKRTPGRRSGGATLVFPTQVAPAAAYRSFATALSANGADAFVMQYPQRADRLTHPAPETVEELATELFEAGDWEPARPAAAVRPLHGRGDRVRVRPRRRTQRRRRCASSGCRPARRPASIAASPRLPTADGRGGRRHGRPRRHRSAPARRRGLRRAAACRPCGPTTWRSTATRAVPMCGSAPTSTPRRRAATTGSTEEMLQRLGDPHRGAFTLSLFDGGHFYLNDHTEAVAELVNAMSDRRRRSRSSSSAWRWRRPAASTPPTTTGRCCPNSGRR